MAPIIDRFKSFFRSGSQPASTKRLLTHVIKYDVDPALEWQVVEDLGDGAFGMVQKVQRINDHGRFAAAKCISLEDGEELEDLVVEIAILSAYPHSNVVGLIDAYFIENKISMMLEFCAGGAVDDIMLELGKPLNESQICYITHYVLLALEYLHANLVIHRDLKAGNILLTSDGTVKLADFGVSAMMKEKNEKRTTFIGTPYWMAPEVLVCETFKDNPYDCISDIWSLGITCIEMAQVDPPHYQISTIRVVVKIQKANPPTLDNPQRWSTLFNDFIASCLVKNPNDRPAAKNLKTHPFVNEAPDKRPIIMLLNEKNADIVNEEVLLEETGSVDESGSVKTVDFDSSSEVGSQKFSAPGTSSDFSHGHKRLAEKLSPDATPIANEVNGKVAKKRFAAPKPPDEDHTPLAIHQDRTEENQDVKETPCRNGFAKSLTRFEEPLSELQISENSPKQKRNISPGKEALEILDDLDNVLDNDEENSTPPPPEPPIDYDETKNNQGFSTSRNISIRNNAFNVDRPQSFVKSDGNSLRSSTSPRRSKHIRDVYVEPISSISAMENNPHLRQAADEEPKLPSCSSESLKKIDYCNEKENRPIESQGSINSAKLQGIPQITSMLHRQQPNRATVTRKTRTYMVDGVQVTSTTLHVLGAQQDYAMRKKELQELKRLQRQEARDRQLLNERNEQEKEVQDRKFTDFRYNVIKAFDTEMEQLCKLQKKRMEELERIQDEEKKQVAKNIRITQEKEYRDFQIQQREELKRLKYETDLLPKNQRKDTFRIRKEQLEHIQANRENSFFAHRQMAANKVLDDLQQRHQEALARLDRQFLKDKQDLQRTVESTLWEQERQQMKERFALRRQQLKGNFNNQRYLMQQRHTLETEHIQKAHQASEEHLIRSLAAAKKHMPKTLRSESKTRVQIFRESLRINYPNESSQQWHDRIRDFEEHEKRSIRQKLDEYDLKCKRRLEELRESNEIAQRELEQIQTEKSEMILKSEEQKVAEYEEEYKQVLADWEQQLPFRKRELEDRFQKEIYDQDVFYAPLNNSMAGHDKGPNSISSL
ncbi:unnamed protein product [Bursaphelenchus okinawaensis]|uniref:Protein kinase domain-containing protein n=1 Tax=Bursaphelenchus okinawaensis TaxID=465554 RepID=A0A811KEL1_9BILA|nr:unnamed protein product [Bursaphelenchus okinawaensis]CAG9100589.1 unnamed protein product [Bursaphelenchus okinawaensis]